MPRRLEITRGRSDASFSSRTSLGIPPVKHRLLQALIDKKEEEMKRGTKAFECTAPRGRIPDAERMSLSIPVRFPAFGSYFQPSGHFSETLGVIYQLGHRGAA